MLGLERGGEAFFSPRGPSPGTGSFSPGYSARKPPASFVTGSQRCKWRLQAEAKQRRGFGTGLYAAPLANSPSYLERHPGLSPGGSRGRGRGLAQEGKPVWRLLLCFARREANPGRRKSCLTPLLLLALLSKRLRRFGAAGHPCLAVEKVETDPRAAFLFQRALLNGSPRGRFPFSGRSPPVLFSRGCCFFYC